MTLDDSQAHIPDLDSLILMNNEEDQIWPIQPGEAESEVAPEETDKRNDPLWVAPIRREAVKKTRKAGKLSLTVSLVHGDVVILEGDDFEVCFSVNFVTRSNHWHSWLVFYQTYGN